MVRRAFMRCIGRRRRAGGTHDGAENERRILDAAVRGLSLAVGAVRAGAGTDGVGYFAQLPITLFENTPEGLSEDEKLRLIEQGASEFWEVERFDADRLVLVSRPFGETRVGLRVFRGGDRLLAALGTDGGAMCALELWQEDATGGFVPANPPDDPQLSDFLASGQRLAADVSPAFMFCLEDDGLDVRPLFWGPAGLVDVPVAKSVRYIWKSGAFEKTVSGKPE